MCVVRNVAPLLRRDLEDTFPVDYRDGIKTCDAATQCSADKTDYCLLTCDKFNSVFFCDKDHPQDIFVSDRPGEESGSTYNVMVDAVLSSPRTRAMYLRRLRTLMDLYLATDYIDDLAMGYLEVGPPTRFTFWEETKTKTKTLLCASFSIIFFGGRKKQNPHWYRWYRVPSFFMFWLFTPPSIVLYDAAIKEDAFRDSAKWGVGSVRGIEQGILQLRTQALPARRRQLFSEQSEVPGPQPPDAGLHFGALEAAAVDPEQSFVELVNHNAFAVDISGWSLSGGGIRHTMKPGTVLAPGMSLVVVGWGFCYKLLAFALRSTRSGDV